MDYLILYLRTIFTTQVRNLIILAGQPFYASQYFLASPSLEIMQSIRVFIDEALVRSQQNNAQIKP